MSQQRLSLSLSRKAERRARSMGRRVGSVSAYVEQLIEADERRDRLRQFIDEHFRGVESSPEMFEQVTRELGLTK
jgi:hypothetical protein